MKFRKMTTTVTREIDDEGSRFERTCWDIEMSINKKESDSGKYNINSLVDIIANGEEYHGLLVHKIVLNEYSGLFDISISGSFVNYFFMED